MSSYNNIISIISNYHSYKLTLERIEELFMLDIEEFRNSYFFLPYKLQGAIIFSLSCLVISRYVGISNSK